MGVGHSRTCPATRASLLPTAWRKPRPRFRASPPARASSRGRWRDPARASRVPPRCRRTSGTRVRRTAPADNGWSIRLAPHEGLRRSRRASAHAAMVVGARVQTQGRRNDAPHACGIHGCCWPAGADAQITAAYRRRISLDSLATKDCFWSRLCENPSATGKISAPLDGC